MVGERRRQLPAAYLDKSISDAADAPGANGELLDILKPMGKRVPETMRRVRQRLEAVFANAVVHGYSQNNAALAIAPLLRERKSGRKQRHLRALHYRDVPDFVAKLRESQRIGPAVKLAMEFGILAAARSGEVRGAAWGEIGRKAKLWTVPGERMKGGEPHVVHLSPRALEILAEAAKLRTDQTSDKALVFPPPRDGSHPLADMTLTMALRRLETGRKRDDGKAETYGDGTTMHGLARSTFSTWANSERIASSEVVEAALTHTEADRTKAAYDHSRTEGERFERDLRALRLAWAEYVCSPPPGHNVVAFHRKRRAQ